jgi:hypothetical protein
MTALFVQNLGGGFLLVFLILSIAYFILWIYRLIDAIRSDFKDPNMKLIWIIVLLFAQGLGPLAYLIMGKGTKRS